MEIEKVPSKSNSSFRFRLTSIFKKLMYFKIKQYWGSSKFNLFVAVNIRLARWCRTEFDCKNKRTSWSVFLTCNWDFLSATIFLTYIVWFWHICSFSVRSFCLSTSMRVNFGSHSVSSREKVLFYKTISKAWWGWEQLMCPNRTEFRLIGWKYEKNR